MGWKNPIDKMAPTDELSLEKCIISCEQDSDCVTTIQQNIKNDQLHCDGSEINDKGQIGLATALRTLRWSKSKKSLLNNDETVLNDEKCRMIITLKEVAEHDSCDDCWIVLYDRVYNVTDFLNEVHVNHESIIK